MRKTLKWSFVAGLLVIAQAVAGYGQIQDRRVGRRWGGEITYEPRGPGVIMGALDPAVLKWYVPQELFEDYRWQQGEYTNYARDYYERYVSTTIEGEPFYDLYGNYLTRGWLAYDWNQNMPAQFGSSIFKDETFNQWFSAILVSSDSHSQYFYAITVGDRIRTTLTPLTFSKPAFNGMQMDFGTDKYEATLLLSRISEPVVGVTPQNTPRTITNATNLIGGRATAQVGEFVKLGATLVDAHNSTTLGDAFQRNPFVGSLGVDQGSEAVSAMALILSDDSPEDGRGGATLFSHDIIITSEEFATGERDEFRLREVVSDPAKWPIVSGGTPREGTLSADGEEKIVINYDFADLAYTGPRPSEIVDIRFDLVVANDYKLQIWSDRQTGLNPMPGLPLTGQEIDELEPALLDIASAPGNVKDNSNQTRVVFDYGLPSARLVYGFDIDVKDVFGFDAYGEFDVSRSYTQYPNPARFADDRSLMTHSSTAEAWMVNVSRIAYPFFFFGEAFSLDPDYSTSAYIVDSAGGITYDDQRSALYEFVDDNDDQDRSPDWFRGRSGGDVIVFPGWDENNDFISDFNQNDNRVLNNRIPDYEEPFFRYHADRPEFLFGIDLNNNNWVDRFENDDLPDFPYKTDHEGYNVYLGTFVAPDAKVTVGRLREDSKSSDHRNYTTYGLVTFDRDYLWVRVRFFDMLKRVEDDIPDDRREMSPHLHLSALALVPDILPARNTWVNSAYLQLDFRPTGKLNLINKVKYDLYAQQGQAYKNRTVGPILEERTDLFGLINKADYTREIGGLVIQPRFKSELRRQAAFVERRADLKDWTGTGTLLLKHPFLRRTFIEAGGEFTRFRDMATDEDAMLDIGPAGLTNDFENLVLAIQWTTSGAYLGYQLTTQFGLSYGRRWEEHVVQKDDELKRKNEIQATSTSFITVYAGLQ